MITAVTTVTINLPQAQAFSVGEAQVPDRHVRAVSAVAEAEAAAAVFLPADLHRVHEAVSGVQAPVHQAEAVVSVAAEVAAVVADSERDRIN